MIGKGLGGGIMPLAAMLAARRLDCAPEAALGHYTHEKSPVGCAAALATLDVIDEEKLIDRARELGARGLATAARHEGAPSRHSAMCGASAAISASRSAAAIRPAFADRLLYRCLARGLSFKVGGGSIITLCPPLTIPLDEFDAALAILDEAFERAPRLRRVRRSHTHFTCRS